MSYVSQQFLQSDNSSIANFIAWGSAVSAAVANMGWLQQNDTGQVVWTATVLTLTQAAVSGGNTTFSYSSFTGPAPRIGMSVTTSGFVNGANNASNKVITAVSGGASGTFTVVLGGVNETHAGSATTTAIAAVPGASTYAYEIWAPADALQTGATTFFLKLEYGTDSTHPNIQVTLCTSTNGAGTASGTSVGPYNTNSGAANEGALTYETYFSGDTNRLGMLIWRNHPSAGGPIWLAIERTKNTDGTDSSDGVTLFINRSQNGQAQQATINFGVGTTVLTNLITCYDNANASQVFNNNVPVYPVFPVYGKVGNPCTVLAIIHTQDVVDTSLITVTLYGSSRTYLAAAAGVTNFMFGGGNYRVCMRYD